MIYAMSDIHGCLEAFEEKLSQVELEKNDRLILLGDYIDYGRESGQVLKRIYNLQQKYGDKKVIALKGNHEDMLLTWIDTFRNPVNPAMESAVFDGWLRTDDMQGNIAYRTLISEKAFAHYTEIAKTASFSQINHVAAELLLSEQGKLIDWIRNMPLYYQTDTQIFVHAGVNEEAEDLWMHGTPDHVFLWKYPATVGTFYKTIIAGHVGTHRLAEDDNYHDIFYDGASHYYIDGTVYNGGQLNLLVYDEKRV